MDASTDVVAFVIEDDVATIRAVLLDGAAWGAGSLVAAEENIGARVTDHCFQVVDDTTTAAHARGGNNDAGASFASQIVDGVQVVLMVVDGRQLLESKGLSAALEFATGFGVPVGLQFSV